MWLKRRSRPSLSERVQKFLANAGLGSRREVERWIAEGRLRINGRLAEPGDRVDGTESFRLDNQDLNLVPPENRTAEHLMYYKPAGEITTRDDPEGRRTVFESLPPPRFGRWITVGRLDLSTSGLLLLTTDGELAHRLMHPSYEVPRVYSVRVLGRLSDGQVAQLKSGVELEDGPASVREIRAGGGTGANVWYEVVLDEGRNREVRRLFEAVGLKVSRLIRVQYGPLRLTRLRRGESRALTRAELSELYSAVGLRPPVTGPARPVTPQTRRRR